MKRMFLFMAGIGIVAATFAENRQPNTSQDAKSIVRLSVAFMAIGEHEIQKIGNLPSDTGIGALQPTVVSNILYELTHGNNPSNMACVRASLDNTKHFFAQSGITRLIAMGYMDLKNGSKDGAKLKYGGTLFVKTRLKSIQYGVAVNAKDCMVNGSMMELDFDLTTTIPSPLTDEGHDYRDVGIHQKISCPIGQTTLVCGSFCGMIDEDTPPSHIRCLRSLHPLDWFVDDSGEKASDRRLVVMICPEIVDGTQNVTPDGNKVVNIPMPKPSELDADHECEACKKRGGFLSWLDWFMF